MNENYWLIIICLWQGLEDAAILSLPSWKRSSSAPCGAYNDDGLKAQWKPFDSRCRDSDGNVIPETKANLAYVKRSSEIKEEIIEPETDSSYKLSNESNNQSSTNYSTYVNDSLSETNITSSDGSRTNDRKLISPPSQRASLSKSSNTLRGSKYKVKKSPVCS